MWTFLVAIVPLILMIFQEFFSAQAKAKEEDRKFVIDQALLKQIVDTAVNNWNAQNAKDSSGASDAWDSADGENRK